MTQLFRNRLVRRIALGLGSALISVSMAVLVCVALVHFAPGFGSDIRELDPRLNAESVQALRTSNGGGSFWGTLNDIARRVTHRDLGKSQAFQRPIAELLRERMAVTAKPLFAGIFGGWGAALILSLANRIWGPIFARVTSGFSLCLLCVPAPILAFALLSRSASSNAASYWVGFGVALIVLPRILLVTERILLAESKSLHVDYARNKGLTRGRVLLAHVVWPAAPSLLATVGSSVGIALSGVMPIEVVCDSPGIGQLAWLATQQRDLPLLLAVTLMVSVTAIVASSFSDVSRFRSVLRGSDL